MHGIFYDFVTQLPFKGVLRHQVHRASHDGLQVFFQIKKAKKTRRRLVLHQNIYIAVWPCSAS